MNELLSAQPERKHRAGLSRIMIAHVAVELLAENGVLYILGGPPAFPFANAEAFARAGQIPEDLYQGGEDEFRRLVHDIQANLRGPIRAYKFEIWAGDAQPEAYGAGALERRRRFSFIIMVVPPLVCLGAGPCSISTSIPGVQARPACRPSVCRTGPVHRALCRGRSPWCGRR